MPWQSLQHQVGMPGRMEGSNSKSLLHSHRSPKKRVRWVRLRRARSGPGSAIGRVSEGEIWKGSGAEAWTARLAAWGSILIRRLLGDRGPSLLRLTGHFITLRRVAFARALAMAAAPSCPARTHGEVRRGLSATWATGAHHSVRCAGFRVSSGLSICCIRAMCARQHRASVGAHRVPGRDPVVPGRMRTRGVVAVSERELRGGLPCSAALW